MDNTELLNMLKLSKECFSVFEKCTFMRPQLHPNKNYLSIKVLTKDYIDISLIDELTNKLQQYLSMEVKLIFTVTNNTNINTSLLISYLNYFLKLHKIDKQLIPIVFDDHIEIDADI